MGSVAIFFAPYLLHEMFSVLRATGLFFAKTSCLILFIGRLHQFLHKKQVNKSGFLALF